MSYLQKTSKGLKLYVVPGDSHPTPVHQRPFTCKLAWDRQIGSAALQRCYALQQQAAGKCKALTPYKQVLGAEYIGILPTVLADSEIRAVTATYDQDFFMFQYDSVTRW